MQKMNIQECNEISGGFAISAIISSIVAAVPIITSAIANTAGLIKSLKASKGEIKTKDLSTKWEDGDKNNLSIGFHYCI